MPIYVANIPANFYPNPTRNDRALKAFLKRLPQQEEEQQQPQQ